MLLVTREQGSANVYNAKEGVSGLQLPGQTKDVLVSCSSAESGETQVLLKITDKAIQARGGRA